MFSLMGWFFKCSLLVTAVLVASHLIEWNGKTVSDRVQTTMSQVQRTPAGEKLRRWADKLVDSAEQEGEEARKSARKAAKKAIEKVEAESDALLGSERAKLRALIRELNN